MAIYIEVTNTCVGKGKIYPLLGRRGKAVSVPQYKMILKNNSGSTRNFSVTRDTMDTIKGNLAGDRECPPNKSKIPYIGISRRGGLKGFRIELSEPGIPKQGEAHGIRGLGKSIRYNMQIHLGPAKSEGCILLKGWHRGRDAFEQTILRLIKEDKKHQQACPDKIYVVIKKR